jgi:hypothetical protein
MAQRHDNPDFEERRARARRTAAVVGLVAVALFLASIIGAWLRS